MNCISDGPYRPRAVSHLSRHDDAASQQATSFGVQYSAWLKRRHWRTDAWRDGGAEQFKPNLGLQPSLNAPANALSGARNLTRTQEKGVRRTYCEADIQALSSLDAARDALAQCAMQAERFVVGKRGRRPTSDATFVYRVDGPMQVRPKQKTMFARNRRSPLTFAQVLQTLPQVRRAQDSYLKLRAIVENLGEQHAVLKKRPLAQRLLRPSDLVLVQDPESLVFKPIARLLARYTRCMSEQLTDLQALLNSPSVRHDAWEAADEGNARWKIDGFVWLRLRLDEFSGGKSEALEARRFSSFEPDVHDIDRRSERKSSSSAVDSVVGQTRRQSFRLALWYTDLTNYHTFLTELEAQYVGNGLQRSTVSNRSRPL